MATIIEIDGSSRSGTQVLQAIGLMRQGLGKLRELNGLRANAIGEGLPVFKSVFGVASDADAQALNDRWAATIAAFESAPAQTIRDLLDGTTG